MEQYIDPTTISFPGLGIDTFTVDKVAFSIGTLEVRWYGILITLGIVLAFLYATWRGKTKERIVPDDVIDIGLFTVVFGVLGARLYYVLTTLDSGNYQSFVDVIAIWNGGLGIYGGIIGGCIGILVACRIKKLKWRRVFDMIAPGVMIAQAIGRWGNFFNGEAHGYAIETTTRFDFMGSVNQLSSGEGTLFHLLRMSASNSNLAPVVFYHPTFFYECVWNVLGFVLINLFYKRKKYDGQVVLLYFTWYGFGRMFIEGFRSDSLLVPGTSIRISQLIGLLCALVGTALLVTFLVRKTKEPVFESTAKTDGSDSLAALTEQGKHKAKKTVTPDTKKESDLAEATTEDATTEDATTEQAAIEASETKTGELDSTTETQKGEEEDNGKID